MIGIWQGRIGVVIAAAMLAFAMPGLAEEEKEFNCVVPEEFLEDNSPLVNVAAAIRDRARLSVLAIGSLSTAGAGSSPATSWPARLQEEIGRRFPAVRVDVLNRGRARQHVADMLAKLDADVRDAKPDLVIWESGTLDAMDNTDPLEYSDTLLTGIDRLLAADIDVLLMDPQYSKASTAVIDFEPYVEAVEHTADMRDLIHFSRFSLMRYWVSEGMVSFNAHPRAQQVRVADQVYACIAGSLAQMIANGVAAATPEAETSGAATPLPNQ